ncbi:hypothetical protein M3640_20685, partial [Bacillus velezensis]|nr:hypothetical protein [Bacillus velezensis]
MNRPRRGRPSGRRPGRYPVILDEQKKPGRHTPVGPRYFRAVSLRCYRIRPLARSRRRHPPPGVRL